MFRRLLAAVSVACAMFGATAFEALIVEAYRPGADGKYPSAPEVEAKVNRLVAEFVPKSVAEGPTMHVPADQGASAKPSS